MIVGTNKETKTREVRVALLPSGAETLVAHGHTVLVEKGAGAGAGWTDEAYFRAGAKLVDDPKQIFKEADLVYKVKEPQSWEYDLMRRGQTLFTYIHSAGDRPLCDALLRTGVWGVAFEDVELEDRRLPLLEPMSFIAGYMGMIKGFELLQTLQGGLGQLPGGMPGARSSRVMILGGGFVGQGAMHVALGLGAEVTVLDVDVDKLRELGARYPSVRTLFSNAESIRDTLERADVLLNAVMWPKSRKGHLVTKEMLRRMPGHGVVVDVSADIRGALETCERQTTHEDPVYEVDGRVHYVVANIPALAARTASEALSSVTLPYAVELADKGPAKALLENDALRRGLTCIGGHMVRKITADWFGCAHLTDEEVRKVLRDG